jgi:CDP-glucose 4,6-dehydratase
LIAEGSEALSESNFWKDRPTLVTGATGFLGQTVSRQLVGFGADVISLVRSSATDRGSASSFLNSNTTVANGDVRDQAGLENLLAKHKIDTVFHFAAQTIVGSANKDPIPTFEANIAGTWAILEACRKAGSIRQMVLSSSDKAYGEAKSLPYTEELALLGGRPYETSKACADLLAQSYASAFGIPVAITRCGNFYGPGDFNWSRIVPGTVRSVVKGERPLIRSDGLFVRDYFHIQDGASANLLLAEKLAGDPTLKGQAFNFSNETYVTVLDLVKKILAYMNSSLEPDVRNEASNEIRNQSLSAQKARRILGWKPHFTLDERLGQTIDWYVDYFSKRPSD